jgi:sensor c-di-GMP phosphodiesterase-like protein
MGIAAVAEGVETDSQAAALKGLGCQIAQGFYFSEPLCAGDFDELLTRHFAPLQCAVPGIAELAAAPLACLAVSPAR